VTIAHLLTHVSGLKPYLDVNGLKTKDGPGPNPDAVIARICSLPKSYETEKSCVYSCLNFVLLARIVEEVSGEPMEELLKRRVWRPLGMKDTVFFLTDEQRKRAAPTRPDGSAAYRGIVHDPLARYYATSRHCCGNAGLFTTARDLAIFAQMLLNGGRCCGARILKPKTVELFTTRQTPDALPERGLGWDINSPYASTTRGSIVPQKHSFGHSGFTGTSLWMNKRNQTLFLILSNRTHMENGAVQKLRNDVADIVGRSIETYRKPARSGNGEE
jgi:CubicO group peptidase (beta-lactamase class C family)